jgi:ABC-type uncharacterized transport system substrate-binding protein
MERRTLYIYTLLAVISAAEILAYPLQAPAQTRRVTAILTSNAAPYREHLEGFVARFDGEVEVSVLDSDTSALAGSLAKNPPPLILAIGSSAAEFAARNSSRTPVLFTMVYYPERHDLVGRNNVAGISLRVPAEKTLEALEAVKPRSKEKLSVGVLISKGKGAEELASLKAALTKHGHTLIAREVESDKDVGRALNSLLAEVKVLWLVADPAVLPDPEFLKAILSKALDNNVAVVGLSDAHVRIGALVAVSVDYRLEGDVAARLAMQILSGREVSEIGVLPPQSLIWSLNTKVARELNWSVLRSTRKRFERVYP